MTFDERYNEDREAGGYTEAERIENEISWHGSARPL